MAAALVGVLASGLGHAADFTVTNSLDAGPGSFRQAILDANSTPGRDRISFNLPGTGVQTISALTALPSIVDPVEIDGYSQPGARQNTRTVGFDGQLLIEIDGVGNGLTLEGEGGCVVRGLVLNRCFIGIFINSPSNIVTGNFIGVTPDGTQSAGVSYGILTSRATGCRIGGSLPSERNVIAGAASNTIRCDGFLNENGQPAGATNFVVMGNYLGVDVSGLVPLPRNATSSTLSVHLSEGLVLGGLEPGAGNVLATGFLGVHLYAEVQDTQILGNLIGVGADGSTSIHSTNGNSGIEAVSRTRIEGNTISCCRLGLNLVGDGITVLSNRIYSNSVGGILSPRLSPLTFASSTLEGDHIVLRGQLSAKTNTAYHVEFFAARAPSPNGYLQGEEYLGAIELTTADSGLAPFTVRYPSPPASLGWVTATATDPDGNTSGFSAGAQSRSVSIPYFHRHPSSISVTNGSAALLTAELSGAAPISFQWTRNGVVLPDATNVTLAFPAINSSQQGSYRLTAQNTFGAATSNPAEVTVLTPPMFIWHPVSQVIATGQWVTLSAAVSEFTTPPIGFRWRSNGVFVAASVGAQSDNYFTFRAGPKAEVYLISVVVTNPVSSIPISSETARIVVSDDRDADGLPDGYEAEFGLNPNDPTDAGQDPDRDGVATRDEYIAGTDPTNSASVLRIQRVAFQAGQVRLEFNASSNKTYRVESREELPPGDLLDPGLPSWHGLADLPARSTNSPVLILDRPKSPSVFYRLKSPAGP